MAADIEAQVQRLVRFYGQAINRLIERFVGEADIYRPRFAGLIQQSMREIEQLRRMTTKWGQTNLEELYWKAQKDVDEWVMKATGAETLEKPGFGVVNDEAIQALLNDPETGFISATSKALDSVQAGLNRIHNQAKLLRTQQAAIHETIARVGILEGRPIAEVRKALMEELLSGKPSNELTWQPKLRKLGNDHILGQLAQLPYVKFSTGNGAMRLDKYCDLVARTKTRQVVTTARRYKLLEIGEEIVRVNNSLPLTDDACTLYIGKAFALTERAAKDHGIAHVKQLPNGGTPFHPNCTHNEMPWFPEYEDPKDVKAAFAKVPTWALDRTWAEVQSEYLKRGGIKAAAQWNENVKKAQNTGGRQRRGGQKLNFDLPEQKGRPARARASAGSGEGRELESGARPATTEKWTDKVKAKLEEFGGRVTTPEQAIEVGKIAEQQIEQQMRDKGGGFRKELATKSDELYASQEQLNDLLSAKSYKVMTPDEQSTVKRLDNRISALKQSQKAAFMEMRDLRQSATLSALKKVRKFGTAKPIAFDPRSDKVAKQAVTDALQSLPADWIKSIEKEPLLAKLSSGRAGYGPKTISQPDFIQMQKQEGLAGKNTDTILHELMHRMEQYVPGLRELERKYWRQRAAASGEKAPKWLGYPYARNEIGYRDKWKDRYLGKDSGSGYLEVLSCGAPAAMGIGDSWLGYRLSSDKELLRFILGCLTGA